MTENVFFYDTSISLSIDINNLLILKFYYHYLYCYDLRRMNETNFCVGADVINYNVYY